MGCERGGVRESGVKENGVSGGGGCEMGVVGVRERYSRESVRGYEREREVLRRGCPREWSVKWR